MEDDLAEEKRTITADTLVQVFSDRMDRQQSPYGFYGWSGLKYFLFTQENGEGRLPWSRFDEASLEHVIPQSSTADGYDGWWKRQIQDFVPVPIGAHPDENTRKDCRRRKRALVNSLGNFVLLTQAENASVSDDPWERYSAGTGSHKAVAGKKAFYADLNHVSSAGARVVAETDGSWNAYRVRERGRKLFKELANQLGVAANTLSEDKIDKALGFEQSQELQNTQFEPLSSSEATRNISRCGTETGLQLHGGRHQTINLIPAEIDNLKRQFIQRYGIAYVDINHNTPNLTLARKNDNGRQVLFQLFLRKNGTVGFIFYSNISATRNNNLSRNYVVGPFLQSKIDEVFPTLVDAFERDYPSVKSKTEGVCAKLVLNHRIDALTDPVFNKLKRGYSALLNGCVLEEC